MRNETLYILVILFSFIGIIIYYERKVTKRIFDTTKARINKIYDSAKAFLFVHFLDNSMTDNDSVDETNIN